MEQSNTNSNNTPQKIIKLNINYYLKKKSHFKFIVTNINVFDPFCLTGINIFYK